jgi:hypothetical protein
MLSLTLLLLLLAFAVTIAAAVGRAPLWPAVLLIVIAELIATGARP